MKRISSEHIQAVLIKKRGGNVMLSVGDLHNAPMLRSVIEDVNFPIFTELIKRCGD